MATETMARTFQGGNENMNFLRACVNVISSWTDESSSSPKQEVSLRLPEKQEQQQEGLSAQETAQFQFYYATWTIEVMYKKIQIETKEHKNTMKDIHSIRNFSSASQFNYWQTFLG